MPVQTVRIRRQASSFSRSLRRNCLNQNNRRPFARGLDDPVCGPLPGTTGSAFESCTPQNMRWTYLSKHMSWPQSEIPIRQIATTSMKSNKCWLLVPP